MKLTIFAATGGIGSQVLEQAVDAGHDVTAVVRNPAKLRRDVRVVTADLAGGRHPAHHRGERRARVDRAIGRPPEPAEARPW